VGSLHCGTGFCVSYIPSPPWLGGNFDERLCGKRATLDQLDHFAVLVFWQREQPTLRKGGG